MKNFLKVAVAASLTLGLATTVGTGVASARGKPPAVTATGTTTCNFHGQLVLNTDGSLSLSGNITPSHGVAACTSKGGSLLRTGHINQTLPTSAVPGVVATDLCPAVAAAVTSPQTLADLAGGAVAWSPGPKVAASVGVGLTGGSLSVASTSLSVTYTGSSVTSGSFTGSSTGLSASTDLASVQASCLGGAVTSIPVRGTLSL
ncbi:MAG: hypothetical protein WCI26_11230 [Acidimicrobiales bacterium]